MTGQVRSAAETGGADREEWDARSPATVVVTPTDCYTISGTGYNLEGKVHHAAGAAPTTEAAVLPYVVASDAQLMDGRVVGDSMR